MSIEHSPSGIDVSNHQRHIDWPAVAASGQVFAFMKATEGTYFNDKWFPWNWQRSREAGLNRGAYHFARPSNDLPEAEASFFLASVNNAGGLEPGDMLVLDMEDTNYQGGGPYGNAGAWSLGFCEYIEAAVGFAPVFYWATWYLPTQIQATPELSKYPLWLARYQNTLPTAPQPWDQLSFWQYSDEGAVPGVSGHCDMNIFNGSAANIPLLGMPGSLPQEPELPEYAVGPGILDAMQDYGDRPATNEHYLTPDWSEAYGASGRKYVYIASLNRVESYAPS